MWFLDGAGLQFCESARIVRNNVKNMKGSTPGQVQGKCERNGGVLSSAYDNAGG